MVLKTHSGLGLIAPTFTTRKTQNCQPNTDIISRYSSAAQLRPKPTLNLSVEAFASKWPQQLNPNPKERNRYETLVICQSQPTCPPGRSHSQIPGGFLFLARPTLTPKAAPHCNAPLTGMRMV